jgi:hypothetical protein
MIYGWVVILCHLLRTSNADSHSGIYLMANATPQKGVYFITIRSKDFVTTKKIIKHY